MPEPYFNQMTPAGYQQIETEIQQLQQQRPARIKALQEARALGDLSENAEYSAAKADLRHLESRLRYLNKQLQYAQVVKPQTTDRVELGKHVTVTFLDDQDQVTYEIVGKQEADLTAQKISAASPLGKAVSDQKIGTVVTVTAPQATYQVRIDSIK